MEELLCIHFHTCRKCFPIKGIGKRLPDRNNSPRLIASCRRRNGAASTRKIRAGAGLFLTDSKKPLRTIGAAFSMAEAITCYGLLPYKVHAEKHKSGNHEAAKEELNAEAQFVRGHLRKFRQFLRGSFGCSAKLSKAIVFTYGLHFFLLRMHAAINSNSGRQRGNKPFKKQVKN